MGKREARLRTQALRLILDCPIRIKKYPLTPAFAYAKQFGEHAQDRSGKIKAWLSFYPGVIATILIDILLTPPIALTPIYMGFAFAVFWHLSGCRFII